MNLKFRSGKFGLKNLLLHALLVVLGAAIYAVAVSCFYVPAKLMSGGATGIALILNRLFSIPVGVVMIVTNIPLFFLGYRKMGREFFILSIVGVVSSSLLIDFFSLIIPEIPALYSDHLLSAALGGAIAGVGLGMSIAVGGSTGGSDILALLFNKHVESISVGRIILITDLVIILTGAAIFRDISAALYTFVAMYAASVALDSVLYGANIASLVFIVTQKPEPVSLALMQDLDRGLTVMNGRGGYTGAPQNVLICAIGRRQLSRLKRIVKLNDPGAFVIVSEAKEVMGEGFKRLDM
jgi:uncharacterized membrane-anchored protein YitT (DUF2179 family)